MSGHARRLDRIFSPTTSRALIVPVDDGLIFGPYDGLSPLQGAIEEIVEGRPNALLAFPGVFLRHQSLLQDVGWIVNITASTCRRLHTRKRLSGNVADALKLGADGVAVHANISSRFEPEMLAILGTVGAACREHQLPLIAIVYPRREAGSGDDNYEPLMASDRESYTRLVAHCARIGMELGADVVKTQYTGDSESFARVVEAAHPIPVVIAGGPFRSAAAALQCAEDAIEAGAGGISFGRNVFSRRNRSAIIKCLSEIVHNGARAASVLDRYHPSDEKATP